MFSSESNSVNLTPKYILNTFSFRASPKMSKIVFKKKYYSSRAHRENYMVIDKPKNKLVNWGAYCIVAGADPEGIKRIL